MTDLHLLRRAVNACCTCGGMGPADPGVCPACRVWHRLSQGREASAPDELFGVSEQLLDTADLYGVDPASSYTRVTIGVGRADLEAWQEREKR